MLGEIQRSLDFLRATAASSRSSGSCSAGGAARVPGLDRIFHDKLEIAVDVTDPFQRVEIASSAGDEDRIRELVRRCAPRSGSACARETTNDSDSTCSRSRGAPRREHRSRECCWCSPRRRT